MISVCIPYYDGMKDGAFFLKRAIDSVMTQTYRDYEIVLTKQGKMAANTNAGIKRARGKIIKILYQDDYLAHPNALKLIVDNFKGGWLATGCEHDDGISRGGKHYAAWSEHMLSGDNTIGSPSVVAFENKNPLLFDENLSYALDCELYTRLFQRYGKPAIIQDINVVIGLHSGQVSNLMTIEEKRNEFSYVKQKYNG